MYRVKGLGLIGFRVDFGAEAGDEAFVGLRELRAPKNVLLQGH